jgi:hypothetical protein
MPPAKNRPRWVDEAPRRENGVFHTAVKVGPYPTRADCDQELPLELQRATRGYIGSYLGSEAAELVDLPLPYIHEKIFTAEWEEAAPKLTVGPMSYPMTILHVRLEFDDDVRNEIRRRHDEALVARRLKYTGTGAGLVLGLLGTMFGYLRLDTATRGYYSGRLRLAAGAMILAQSAVLALLAGGIVGF